VTSESGTIFWAADPIMVRFLGNIGLLPVSQAGKV
jgi:hypothetical protein